MFILFLFCFYSAIRFLFHDFGSKLSADPVVILSGYDSRYQTEIVGCCWGLLNWE